MLRLRTETIYDITKTNLDNAAEFLKNYFDFWRAHSADDLHDVIIPVSKWPPHHLRQGAALRKFVFVQ